MSRTVLVTGSSRGIGLAIAKEFTRLGDRVILNGRIDRAELDKAAAELNMPGILADMSDYGQAEKLFAQAGEADVLVNNAGMAHFGLFTDMSPREWDEVLRNNLGTVLNATHLAVPHMVRRKRGVIINISSMWGNSGASCEAVYSAAKGAVHAFTRAMAKELAPSGIRVNAIACGAIETRMNERLSAEEYKAFAEEIPMLRFGKAEEVAELAVFLASDSAEYMTGQVIGLDGGY